MKPTESHNLTVVCRVRPPSEDALRDKKRIVHVLDGQMVILTDPRDEDDILRAKRSHEKKFMFDVAFDSYHTQLDVYLATTKSLIDSVLDGFNATVFAYGPTGTGKTYTMLGTDENPGIMVLALNEIFAVMRKNGESSLYTVSMSYLEVYNELIRDLLCPDSPDLELREDSSGVTVAGLTEVGASSTKEVMDLLMDGNKRRTTEPTFINQTSSRSHAVLQVTVKKLKRARSLTETINIGKLYMIDLAGSERATLTKNRGTRLVEGAHINRSLLALGNCIKALSNGNTSYVNYRDSKLTRLLKDSLGGNCRTVMIAHVTPELMFFDESRNTLQYADRAKRIKTKIRPNLQTVSHHIAKYPIIVEELHKEIERLKKKLSDSESIASVSVTVLNKDRELLEITKAELNKVYNKQLKLKTKISRVNMMKEVDKVRVDQYNSLLQQHDLKKSIYDVLPPIVSASSNAEQVEEIRSKLSRLSTGKDKHSTIIEKLEPSLDQLTDRYRAVEEEFEERVNEDDHHDIISLLTNVHDLEIRLSTQNEEVVAVKKMSQEQTSWSNVQTKLNTELLKIIQSQQQLIKSHNLTLPDQLEDLYKTVHEISEEQYSVLPAIETPVSDVEEVEDTTAPTPMFQKTYNVPGKSLMAANQKSVDSHVVTSDHVMSSATNLIANKFAERETSQTTIHVLSTPSLTGNNTPPLPLNKEGTKNDSLSDLRHVTGMSLPPSKLVYNKAIQLQRLRSLRTEPVMTPTQPKAKKPRNVNSRTYSKNSNPVIKSENKAKIAEKSRIYQGTPNQGRSLRNRIKPNPGLSVVGTNRVFPYKHKSRVIRQ